MSVRLRRLDVAPDVLAEAFDALEADAALVVFAPSRRSVFVGRNVVRTFEGARSAHDLRDALRDAAVDGEVGQAPVGAWGRAFFDGAPRSPVWAGFGEATGFVFARTLFLRDGTAFEQIVDGQPLAGTTRRTSPDDVADPARPYRAIVADAIAAIDRGEIEKVVCARSVDVELGREPDPRRLLATLLELGGETTVFVLRWAGAVFFGATPELLVSIDELRLRTMALAGSRDAREVATEAPPSRPLLEDPKERAEHAFVVDGIRGALQSGVTLDPPIPTPETVVARNVVHLRTPITGRVRDDVDPLDLIAAMHPTPALGGTPRHAALRFIERHEGDLRGWYGAPLGWIDGSGNLELCVTLRSALVRGRRAVLYAGAGVVRGSVPERELGETEAKLAAMRDVIRRLEGD